MVVPKVLQWSVNQPNLGFFSDVGRGGEKTVMEHIVNSEVGGQKAEGFKFTAPPEP